MSVGGMLFSAMNSRTIWRSGGEILPSLHTAFNKMANSLILVRGDSRAPDARQGARDAILCFADRALLSIRAA